jgi:hypothetical protein
MKKVLWTKYFRLMPGFSAKFHSVALGETIDLNDETTPIETLKKLFDAGSPNIGLTEDGEKKFLTIRNKKNTGK